MTSPALLDDDGEERECRYGVDIRYRFARRPWPVEGPAEPGELRALRSELADLRRSLDLERLDHQRTAARVDVLQRTIRSLRGELQRLKPSEWSPTPIIGYRSWRMDPAGIRGVKVRWATRTLTAVCLRSPEATGVPHDTGLCGMPPCGIYAFKEPRFGRYARLPRIDGVIFGAVALTGRVVEHEAGYRAQTAEVVAAVVRYGDTHACLEGPSQIDVLFEDQFRAIRTGFSARGERPDEFLPQAAERYLSQWT